MNRVGEIIQQTGDAGKNRGCFKWFPRACSEMEIRTLIEIGNGSEMRIRREGAELLKGGTKGGAV